jgi:hypothetical protein
MPGEHDGGEREKQAQADGEELGLVREQQTGNRLLDGTDGIVST